MPDPAESRYAIYFAPPRGTALDRFGSRWLGRDAWTDTEIRQPPVAGIEPTRLAALTAAPRRYGFHATLKAPFALASDVSLDAVTEALAAFARTRPPVDAGRLRVSDLRGFLALTLADHRRPVQELADACTEAFQPLARPLTEAEIARRWDRLTERQRAHLRRWNYPYVFEDYLFHMTLTGPVRTDDGALVMAALHAPLAALLDAPLAIDALTLFVEPEPGANLRILKRFPLTGGAAPSY